MPDPLFSVIVPTYRRPRYLADAVESVLAQTVDDFECLLVDDASPEPPVTPDDPRVRLIRRSTNGGAPAARNTGLEAARGRYVTFLDDDDLYTPDRLAMALEALSRAPLALCWKRYLDAAPDSVAWAQRWEGDVRDVVLDGLIPNLGQIAVRRSLAPRFDERFRLADDIEWVLLAAHAGSFATVPRVGYVLRQHSGARETGKHVLRLEGRLLLLEKHTGYFSSHPRAAAYHWKRAGGIARLLGDRRLARSSFLRSLRARLAPEPVYYYLRSLGRSRYRFDPSSPVSAGAVAGKP